MLLIHWLAPLRSDIIPCGGICICICCFLTLTSLNLAFDFGKIINFEHINRACRFNGFSYNLAKNSRGDEEINGAKNFDI